MYFFFLVYRIHFYVNKHVSNENQLLPPVNAIQGYRGKSGKPAPAEPAVDTTPVDDCVQFPSESTPTPTTPADAADTADAAA